MVSCWSPFHSTATLYCFLLSQLFQTQSTTALMLCKEPQCPPFRSLQPISCLVNLEVQSEFYTGTGKYQCVDVKYFHEWVEKSMYVYGWLLKPTVCVHFIHFSWSCPYWRMCVVVLKYDEWDNDIHSFHWEYYQPTLTCWTTALIKYIWFDRLDLGWSWQHLWWISHEE